MPGSPGEVTAILREWQGGNEDALRRLIPAVYEELRRVARARLRAEAPGHLLETTALVHEAYLRFVNLDRIAVRDRSHLLALAARLMRQILVDYARQHRAQKRGGDVTIVDLDGVAASVKTRGIDVLALEEALAELTVMDERLARVVELKFFAGLNIDEMAQTLAVSPATIARDWTTARAWLHQRLTSSAPSPS